MARLNRRRPAEAKPRLTKIQAAYQREWDEAKQTLQARGLPTEPVDISEYIHFGTPEVSDADESPHDVNPEDEDSDQRDDAGPSSTPCPSSPPCTSPIASSPGLAPTTDDLPRLWEGDDDLLPFWSVIAYLEDGQDPIDYKLETQPFVRIREYFRPFGLNLDDRMAIYTAANSEWRITRLGDLLARDLSPTTPCGEQLVWVRDGLTDLPGIHGYTDGHGGPSWPQFGDSERAGHRRTRDDAGLDEPEDTTARPSPAKRSKGKNRAD